MCKNHQFTGYFEKAKSNLNNGVWGLNCVLLKLAGNGPYFDAPYTFYLIRAEEVFR
jgi:hypothetical protein